MTQVKIFASGSKRIEYLEDEVNSWLSNNDGITIKNILTSSNAAAYGGPDSFFAEELYLIVVYQET